MNKLYSLLIIYLLILSVNSRLKGKDEELDELVNNDSMEHFNWTLTEKECQALKPFSIYYSILFIAALFANITVIWVLLKKRKLLLNNLNQVQLVLTIFNLLGTIFGLPLVIATLFS